MLRCTTGFFFERSVRSLASGPVEGGGAIQSAARIHQSIRAYVQRFRAGQQIRLMRFEERENRGEKSRLSQPLPQIVGGEAGEREQPLRPRFLRKRPAEC